MYMTEVKAINPNNVSQDSSKQTMRPVRNAAGFHGKVTGIGADKRHKNNVKGDDNRMKSYKSQIEKDKASDRGISSDDRKERARKNKENSAKKGIDSLLKDIRKESYHDEFHQYINDNYDDLYGQYLNMISDNT